MRKKTVILLLLSGAVLAGEGTELFENGGFEKGIQGWRTLNMSGGCTFMPDRKFQSEGKQSLRIERTGSGRPDWLKQFVDLDSSEGEVTVTVAYRVDRKGRLNLTFGFSGADGEFVGKGMMPLVQSGKTKKFKKATKTFKVPRGATGCGINVMISQKGRFWLDGISVLQATSGKRAKAGALEIRNGTFDKSADGWRPLPGAGAAKVDKKALRLRRSNPRLFPLEGVEQEIRELGRAKRVTLHFAARATPPARGLATIVAVDENGAYLGAARVPVRHAGKDLKAHALKFEIPPLAERLRIALAVRGKGDAWFDDVRLEGK